MTTFAIAGLAVTSARWRSSSGVPGPPGASWPTGSGRAGPPTRTGRVRRRRLADAAWSRSSAGPRSRALPLRLADAGQVLLFGGYFLALTLLLATDLDQRLLPDVVTLPLIADRPGPRRSAAGTRSSPGSCGWARRWPRSRSRASCSPSRSRSGPGRSAWATSSCWSPWACSTGLARSVAGLVVGALAAGVVIGVLLVAAPGHAADLRPVRAVPDHRRVLGRARPALTGRAPARGPVTDGRWRAGAGGVVSGRRVVPEVCPLRTATHRRVRNPPRRAARPRHTEQPARRCRRQPDATRSRPLPRCRGAARSTPDRTRADACRRLEPPPRARRRLRAAVRARPRVAWRLLAVLLVVPLVIGVAAPARVSGDELADARAQQKALQQKIADQKAEVAAPAGAAGGPRVGHGVDDHGAQRGQRQPRPDEAADRRPDDQAHGRPGGLRRPRGAGEPAGSRGGLARPGAGGEGPGARATGRSMLAARVREAYVTDRTPLIQQLLAAGSFTDVLQDVGSYLDLGAQDQAIATQITADQQTPGRADRDRRPDALRHARTSRRRRWPRSSSSTAQVAAPQGREGAPRGAPGGDGAGSSPSSAPAGPRSRRTRPRSRRRSRPRRSRPARARLPDRRRSLAAPAPVRQHPVASTTGR